MSTKGQMKIAKKKTAKADFRPQTRADFIAHPEWVLILRPCNALRQGRAGFQWPESGPVEAPSEWWGAGECPADITLGWNGRADCGGGLHGLLWGEGSADLLDWDESAKWLVVLAKREDVIEIDTQKCKFRLGEVLFCGDRAGAVLFMQDRRADASRAGVSGTATAGVSGTATAGDSGTATAGYGGTATAGDSGTATAGDSGTATAGEDGVIAITWYDSAKKRYRVAIGYIGEGGLKANTKYRANEKGELIEAEA